MVNYCCVRNCKNNSKDNKMVSFFSVPLDHVRQLQWLERIGRFDLMGKSAEVVHKKRVCAKHFEDSMFSGPSFSKSKLKKESIPTLFCCDKEFQANTSTLHLQGKSSLSSLDNIEADQTRQDLSLETEKENESQLEEAEAKIKQLQSEVVRLKKKCNRLSKSSTEVQESGITNTQFIELCKRTFNAGLANFIIAQYEMATKKSKGVRYVEAFE
ncbi:hypothetical protein RI129_009596 [Pyrocoelia pectoralis]|uniref:THAP-type domain-containing protein n=1 Tax=Pyrocoelia pectoralis TaxID=417401 RepID=A0AAN7V7B8_9COLE